MIDIVRIGKVVEVNEVKCTAKVTFADRQELVSGELPIIVPCTLDDKYYYMPAIGERVLCLFDPKTNSDGYILGSFYADTRLPPVGDKNKKYILFDDKTCACYDKQQHLLTLDCVGDIDITAAKNINIKCDASLNIEITKDCNMSVKGDYELNVTGDLSFLTEKSIKIKTVEDVNVDIGAYANINAIDIDLKSENYKLAVVNDVNIKAENNISTVAGQKNIDQAFVNTEVPVIYH